MVDLDVVIYEIPEAYVPINKADPIIIRGSGDITINEFPPELHGKVAPEEFQETILKVNNQLRRSMSINLKWLLCGFICCFCTLGCSMWPAICVNRKVKRNIEKTLELENARLYCQLGLNWSLAKQRSSEPVVLMEYVSNVLVFFESLDSYFVTSLYYGILCDGRLVFVILGLID
ncbi:unnamed protein product [Hydatigera taeniaeformis]|uniref:Erf4 domain-containing protein n=1 Tax=Hydatigena taeniaeformis TaxID=6205 RepID=A0A0R3XBY1_HYDTA|nr:unnamed protein product [Hydatigera taeniaeformis]